MSVIKNLRLLISIRSHSWRSTATLTSAFSSLSSINDSAHGVAAAAAKEEVEEQHGGDKQSLYWMLAKLGPKKGKVAATINAYVREGKVPSKLELNRYVKELRHYGKPHLSLEIFEWMDRWGFNKALRDFPVHLDLISLVKGIEEAELYFKGLSGRGRNQWTYGVLLNWYCRELMEDKALALFKEMDERNLALTSVAYGNVMFLYMRLGKPEKVAPLVEDMKKRDIALTTYIYCIWMTSCSHLGNVEGAERVFEEVERDGLIKCDWTMYSNLAASYVKAGHKEKVELALQKLEQEMGAHDLNAYHLLLSLHAGVSNLSEVHRIWKSLKLKFVVTNMSYVVMLLALSKLDDLVGLKDCYEEWESQCHLYDLRIPHSVIRVYLRNHMVQEAQAVFHRAKERSRDYPFQISETFMTYYLENNQGQQALDCMKATVSEVKNNEWHPQRDIIKEFIRYFEEIGDVDLGEEFCKLLKKVNSLTYDPYKSLLRTYIVAGKQAPNMMERIREDGIVIDTDLKQLVLKVCP